MANSSGRQEVEIGSLSVHQLSAVKKQLDEELEHLTASFGKLHAAQNRFRECNRALETALSPGNNNKQVLVPLTSSLYVPGYLDDLEQTIVDVGTGFYVEKSKEAAKTFYDARVEELSANLKDLESIVQGKTSNLRMVEDGELAWMLERKLKAQQYSVRKSSTQTKQQQMSRRILATSSEC